ncbi:MAG: hypothetical protein ABI378_06525 [Chitinophagaceae bacterium]
MTEPQDVAVPDRHCEERSNLTFNARSARGIALSQSLRAMTNGESLSPRTDY